MKLLRAWFDVLKQRKSKHNTEIRIFLINFDKNSNISPFNCNCKIPIKIVCSSFLVAYLEAICKYSNVLNLKPQGNYVDVLSVPMLYMGKSCMSLVDSLPEPP